MSRQGPLHLPAGERDRRLAEEVLYLHSLWRGGPLAPATIPSRPAGREGTERPGPAAPAPAASAPAPALAPAPIQCGTAGCKDAEHPGPPAPAPAPAPTTIQSRSARRRLEKRRRHRLVRAAAAYASTTSTASPPPPTTSSGSLAQGEAVRSSEEFSNRGSADDDEEGSESDDDEENQEEEATRLFTDLFERNAALRGRYERKWKRGPFKCMVCAAGRMSERKFRGCQTLVQHAQSTSRHGSAGAHRALAAVICRVLGWDFKKLPRIRMDPRGTLGQALAAQATAGFQHAKEDVEIEMEGPGTNSDEEGNEIESNEDAKKGSADAWAEFFKGTDGDKEAIELDNSEMIPEKVNANKDDYLIQDDNGVIHKQKIAKESAK